MKAIQLIEPGRPWNFGNYMSPPWGRAMFWSGFAPRESATLMRIIVRVARSSALCPSLWVTRLPARSVFALAPEIPFAHGAILMCSSATALHALNKSRLRPGESVVVFGAGGLGLSAIQLAKVLGAGQVFAVDIQPRKLERAARFGAVPVNASAGDPVKELNRLTDGRGVDVALELIGLPLTMRQSVTCLAIQGRAVLAGITDKTFEIAPYAEILNKEAEIIGVSDHLAKELPQLLEWARAGALDLSGVLTRVLPLEAGPVNAALDELEQYAVEGRIVIEP